MKIAIATIVLVLTVRAHCSVLPLAWPLGPWGHPVVSVAGPSWASWATLNHPELVLASNVVPQGPVVVSEVAPGGVATSAVGSDSDLSLVESPLVVGEGRYLAKTKGSVHTAPLPGHVNSVTSINVEPAPGTA